MKIRNQKIMLAGILSLIVFSGCTAENGINDASDTQTYTSLTISVISNPQEISVDKQNTAPQANQQTVTLKPENGTQKVPENTPASSTQEQQTSNETTVSKSPEIFESELPPETVQTDMTDLYPEEITKYTDKYSGREFIILNVTPNKIYWNELDGYAAAQGQPLDIAIPAIFEDWVSDADELMIYMSSGSKTFGDLMLDGETKIKGMTYPQYWSRDYLCPIKNGTVCFGEYTDSITNSFSRVDDGVYIEEANYQYSDAPFADNMSVSSLDAYFETIKTDYDALKQKMAENPDTDYDIAGFWGYQDGIRFRAVINNIY